MERAYLDNNATSPLLPEVFEAMRPYFAERFGNPSSPHERGRQAKAAVDHARGKIARLIGAFPEEIVFTSGGSEGDTAALLGLISPGDHVISSVIEHHAVLQSCKRLRRLGAEVTLVAVDEQGRVDPDEVRAALRPRTRLVSLMTASNETGVLQPVAEIGRIAAGADVYFHTDAVQAAGKVPLDVNQIHCDLLSISGHKLHGPPGVGALYVRHGTPLRPLIEGGPQEHGLRAGTENLPGMVGLGAAADAAVTWLSSGKASEMAALRALLERTILETVERCQVNGALAPRLPNTSNISFEGIAGKALVADLDLQGIRASTGSACTSGESAPPYVLMAMGQRPEQAYSAVRFSLGKLTRTEEISFTLSSLRSAVERLRAMSPSFAR